MFSITGTTATFEESVEVSEIWFSLTTTLDESTAVFSTGILASFTSWSASLSCSSWDVAAAWCSPWWLSATIFSTFGQYCSNNCSLYS